MLADAELLGIPHRIVIGERGIKDGILEYQSRRARQSEQIRIDEALPAILERIRGS